jgi:uncharacterized protein
MVTLLDVGAAVDELRRTVTTFGFKGVYLRPNPVGGRALHDPAHDRFWAEAERLGVPVMLREGTDGQLPTAGLDRFDNFFMTHMISHPFEQMLAALPMIACGVVERFPRLKIAFLESGCGWLPFWLHRMHEHWDATFPGAVEELRRNIKGLGETAQRKILGDNARRFMNLPG